MIREELLTDFYSFIQACLIPLGVYGILVLAFLNSSVMPGMVEVLLVPLTLVNPDKWLLYGSVTVVGTVLGSIFGYALGYYGFKGVDNSSLSMKSEKVQSLIEEHGVKAVWIAGVSALPFKPLLIAAGAYRLNFVKVMTGVIILRGFRYLLTAYLVAIYGRYAARLIIENRLLGSIILAVLAISIYILLNYIQRSKSGEFRRFLTEYIIQSSP